MKIYILTVFTLLIMACESPKQKEENKNETINQPSKAKNKMKVQDVFVLIGTEKVKECKDFYIRNFGFEVAFESTIYTQLTIASESGGAFSLALMPPNNPFTDEFKQAFDGKGAYVTIQVANADDLYKV